MEEMPVLSVRPVVLTIVLSFLVFPVAFGFDAPRPRLVVQITVDQLRGDLPFRYQDRFGPGGFRYFMNQGTWFTSAHQPHAFTETVVGHTTLATGAWPSRHGMVGNRWYDRITGQFVNNIETTKYPILPILGEPPCVPSSNKSCKGAAPTAIHTTTLSDELAITTATRADALTGTIVGGAKIFGVSLKDRGAIPMAGHAGKAFWYSDKNGCFVTSSFYYSAYPSWVSSWCEKHPADAYKNTKWELLHKPETYLFRDFDNAYPAGSPAEINMELLVNDYHFGRNFPHTLGDARTGLYQGLTLTPFADELTLNFVEALVKNEGLGKDDIPDYLAISFSVTDYVGHWFSPSSMESEDNILRLDQTLASLLTFLDAEVGLDNTLIILSADHGGPEYPEYLKTIQVNTGRIASQTILDVGKAAVQPKWGDGIILEYDHPYFYLDRDRIEAQGYSLLAIQQAIATAVTKLDGIKVAVPAVDMGGGGMADEALIGQIRRNYDSTRSGDVYVVQELQWQIDAAPSSGPPLLQHDALWAYDTYVPLAFAGFGVPRARVPRDIDTTDIAATLATILRTKFPSGCTGTPLPEITGSK